MAGHQVETQQVEHRRQHEEHEEAGLRPAPQTLAATVRRHGRHDGNDAPGHHFGPISGKRKGLPASALARPMAPQKISVA